MVLPADVEERFAGLNASTLPGSDLGPTACETGKRFSSTARPVAASRSEPNVWHGTPGCR